MSDRQAVECASHELSGARQHGFRQVLDNGSVLSLRRSTSLLRRQTLPWPTAKPVELLALGDSGMAVAAVTQPAAALPAQIAQRVAASTGRPVHVVSHAQPGARTHDVLTKQLRFDAGQPDVVVLLIGTNNVTHLARTRQLAVDTANLLARLHRLGAPVVMSSLPKFGAMRSVPAVLRAVPAAPSGPGPESSRACGPRRGKWC